MQEHAAAEAQPLHQREVGAGRRVLGDGHDLVALLAADAQRLGGGDAHVLEIGNGAESLARQVLSIAGFGRRARHQVDHHTRFDRGAGRIGGDVGQEDAASRQHRADLEAGQRLHLERQQAELLLDRDLRADREARERRAHGAV
jgi:hypothetical protein